MDSTQNSVLCWDSSHHKYTKWYGNFHSHKEAFWEEQDWLLTWPANGLRKQAKETDSGFSGGKGVGFSYPGCAYVVWTCIKTREHLDLPVRVIICKARGKERMAGAGGWGRVMKAASGQKSKFESNSNLLLNPPCVHIFEKYFSLALSSRIIIM